MTGWFLLLAAPALAGPPRFLDPDFAAALCRAWNDSALPRALGRQGSGWIDSAGSEGRQVMVMSRRDCTGWTPVRLVVEADAAGDARCTEGGAFAGGPFQWRFEPTTLQWADFADGFGVMDMPGIMSGFVGPYATAASNISEFGAFFAVTGDLALRLGVDWTCEGADPAKVRREVERIDREDMREILGR